MSSTFDLSPALLSQVVCETLEQLAFAEAQLCQVPGERPADLLSARLRISGSLSGCIGLLIPRSLAQKLAGDVLGDPEAAAEPPALRDAIGEFLNTIAGAAVREAGFTDYELGLPEHGPGSLNGGREVWFEVGEQKLAVVVEEASPT